MIRLQSKYRMAKEKKHYAIKVLAASKIQLMFMSRLYRKQYLYLRSAAVLIQSLARRKSVLLWRNTFYKKILVIQSFWRSCCCRKSYIYLRKEAYNAAVKIQTFYRSISCKYKYCQYIGNIQRLQRLWRRKSGYTKYEWMMIVFKAKTMKRRKNILSIQSFSRMILAKKRVSILMEEKNTYNAAMRLQSFFRMHLAMKLRDKLEVKRQDLLSREEENDKTLKVVIVQCAVRLATSFAQP